MFWLLVIILLMALFGVGTVIEGILQLLLLAVLVVLLVGLFASRKLRSRA